MRILSFLCLLFLLGCNNGPTLNADGSTNPDAKTLAPADATLATVYDRSCKACHSRGLSGAPRTGNSDDWQPRIAKGMDTLMQSTIGGLRGMPPRGACMDCSPDQFEKLIRFMAVWPEANTAGASVNEENLTNGN